MADAYEIQYQGKTVGAVRAEKQGLYYCFHCRCTMPDDGMYRIHALTGDTREDLGICIPVEGKFGMDKKVPMKRLGEGALTFELVPKDWVPEKDAAEPELPAEEETVTEPVIAEEPEESFLPVSEEAPFEHLDKLENARMEVRDDQVGIVIEE